MMNSIISAAAKIGDLKTAEKVFQQALEAGDMTFKIRGRSHNGWMPIGWTWIRLGDTFGDDWLVVLKTDKGHDHSLRTFQNKLNLRSCSLSPA